VLGLATPRDAAADVLDDPYGDQRAEERQREYEREGDVDDSLHSTDGTQASQEPLVEQPVSNGSAPDTPPVDAPADLPPERS
jgi:hypothetical protein